jgi:hypothetical protein
MKDVLLFSSNFDSIRNQNCIYVDKTKFIYSLIEESNPYLLLRPHGFGKSLLVSTLVAILSGRRDLFKGLWIDGSDYDWTPRPIISLKLYSLHGETMDIFNKNLMTSLRLAANLHGIQAQEGDPVSAFQKLITDLYYKFNNDSINNRQDNQVAILIDDYDAAVRHERDRPEKADAIRRALKIFYGVLKDSQDYWNFAFFSGISDISNTSVFSSFANLMDLTQRDEFAAICGFTAEELDENFSELLDSSLDSFKDGGDLPNDATTADLRERMFELYGSYSWDGRTMVLHPWSVIECLDSRTLKDLKPPSASA